jgi:YidC/Oxa1 family membrane protein insertase
MDQKRLMLAIAASVAILLMFQLINPPKPTTPVPAQAPAQQQQQQQVAGVPGVQPSGAPTDATQAAPAPAPTRGPAVRLRIEAPRVEGSLSLRGVVLDDLVLRGYHETVDRSSPLVRMFRRRDTATPYWAQWGFSGAGVPVPGPETDWTASADRLTPTQPVTLRWDNGQGQVFEIALSLDDNYLVTAEQRVVNSSQNAVAVQPWARVRREGTVQTEGFYILHEGFVGVIDGRLKEVAYSSAQEDAQKRGGVAFTQEAAGGWAGFTDKYWLGALAAVDQSQRLTATFRHNRTGGGADAWQVDFTPPQALTVAPGTTGSLALRLFAGAKEVALLDRYRDQLGIPDFDKAIDFGWFYFMTKPFFQAINWIFGVVGNFGVAILIFTLVLKIAFFPLANKAYHSMARMKILGPKMQEIKERTKDDPAKAQAEMMALYRSEKINPASGCLPILLQIPVFFALYKVLFVTIEMRHAPFFGWVLDLSAPDPTNLFNLFGLLPFQPELWSPYFHMPLWAIFMGITMWAQMKLNPTPPDPIQAKVFAWMPLIFTFMLASMPAGLVIYWSWNNLLSIAQQYYIMSKDEAAAAQLREQRQKMAASVRGLAARLPGRK